MRVARSRRTSSVRVVGFLDAFKLCDNTVSGLLFFFGLAV